MRGYGGRDGGCDHFRRFLFGVLGEVRVFVDEAGVEAPAAELGILEDFLVVGDRRLHAVDQHVGERAAAAREGRFPVQVPYRELGAHRVEVGRDHVVGVDRRVHPHPGTARRVVARDAAEAGQELVLRIFGVDAEFDRKAAVLDLLLLVLQRQAGGDADLLLHDVDAGDGLGDGVLDLQPGVHLHEVELVVGIEQEFDRAGVDVAHRPGSAHRQLADVLTLRLGQLRTRRDLDELLVAPLDRAVALEQVDDVALGVAEDLHLDVLGAHHAFLDEDLGLAERLAGFGDHAVVVLQQVFLAVAAADAAAAAAVGRLQHHRIADLVGQRARFLDVFQVVVRARHHRDAGGDHRVARLDLVAHAADHLGRGADEADAAARADGREVGIFGEKAVAGMQGIAAGGGRQVDQGVRVEVAEDGVLADVVGLVGLLHVEGVAVGVGVDGDRLDAQFGAGADDADRNLAPVGDQYFLKHGHRFFDKNNAQSYHYGLMFNRVRHVEPVRVAPVRS